MLHTLPYAGSHQLAYAEYGRPDGYPLLIQHGMIASIRGGGLFARLAGLGLRLICPARPGYGLSSPNPLASLAGWADIVAALVEALKLEEFDVLGISSGAPYSYAIARRFARQARRVFILSGTPALYDAQVRALWPYPLEPQASLESLQMLAEQLFFAGLSPAQLVQDDVRDSRAHNCFGISLDLKLRCNPWGFSLSEIQQPVYMRHSRADQAVPFAAAERTASLLPDCRLEARAQDEHFSQAVLDDFILTTIAACHPAEGSQHA